MKIFQTQQDLEKILKTIKWPEFQDDELEKVEKESLICAATELNRHIRKKEADDKAVTKRIEVVEKILQLAVTMMEGLDISEDSYGKSVKNGILWFGSFFDSIRVKGENKIK